MGKLKIPRLTRVTGIFGVEPFAGGYTEIVIASGPKEVRLRCDPDTDELLLSSGLRKKRRGAVSIVSGRFHVIWMWTMTNQQGYSDGVRIELHAAKKWRVFDFISAASAVEVFEAKKVPNQTPQTTTRTVPIGDAIPSWRVASDL